MSELNHDEHEVILLDFEVQRGAPVGDRQLEAQLSELQRMIEACEWEEAEKRMKTHPDEMHGQRSVTALHLALEGGECPFPLLRTMIEIDPMVPSVIDHNGNTPLHIACAGEFAYDPLVISMLLAAYPQAVFIQDSVERATPLHMLLMLGGAVNLTCLTLLLDVAFSYVAGLPATYVLAVEFLMSPLETSLAIAQHYPPLVVQVAREMALSDPFGFPAFLRPFLHLPAPKSLIAVPQRMDDQKNILLLRDAMKQVPLHIAARRCLRKEVVALMLDDERYPGARKACSVLERKDRYPLFYCALYAAPLDSAECIFEHCKDAVHCYEQYGMLIYHATSNSPHYTTEERIMEVKSVRKDASTAIQSLFAKPKSWEMYKQQEFYLRITYQGHTSTDGFSILHAAAAVISTPQFLRCNINLFPWQLSEYDENGHLPLHLACKVSRPHGINDQFYWMKKDIAIEYMAFRLIPEDRAKDNPITILTESYPKAASVIDKEGNLPLHSAIISGKGMIDGIRSLIQAAPMALSTRNIAHRLYPFMLAAMCDDLDLTLDLLLANPIVVKCFQGH